MVALIGNWGIQFFDSVHDPEFVRVLPFLKEYCIFTVLTEDVLFGLPEEIAIDAGRN